MGASARLTKGWVGGGGKWDKDEEECCMTNVASLMQIWPPV